MVSLDVRVSRIDSVWHEDCFRFAQMPFGVPDTTHPTPRIVEQVAAIVCKYIRHAPDAITLSADGIDAVVEMYKDAISELWDVSFKHELAVEILPFKDYEIRHRNTKQRESKHLGYSDNFPATPMNVDVFDGVLYIPTQYPLHVRSDSSYVSELHDWGNTHLKTVLASELVAVLFHQIRGEWGLDYGIMLDRLAIDKVMTIGTIRDIVCLYTMEIVSSNIFTMDDKLRTVWTDHTRLDAYRCVQALHGNYSLGQIAMADAVGIRAASMFEVGECVTVDFSLDHPNYYHKTEFFSRG